MPNHDGTGPFANGRPGKGRGPCRNRHNAKPVPWEGEIGMDCGTV
jgi:hypothetical protein